MVDYLKVTEEQKQRIEDLKDIGQLKPKNIVSILKENIFAL